MTRLGVACAQALAFGCGVLGIAPAHANIITETISLAGAPLGPFTSLTLGNFSLTMAGGMNEQQEEVVGLTGANAGVYALEEATKPTDYGSLISIAMTNGGVFSVVSLQIAALNGNNSYEVYVGPTSDPDQNKYNGMTENNGQFLKTTFQTFEPAGVSNINSFYLNIVDGGSDYAVTDIVVQFAPEPASVTVLLTGMVGLAAGKWRRRLR